MVLLAIALVALQAAAGQAPKAENPAETTRPASWTGCVTAGSTQGAYRLNLWNPGARWPDLRIR